MITQFGKLKQGDFFKYDNEIVLKTRPDIIVSSYNSIVIQDGRQYYMLEGSQVETLSAKEVLKMMFSILNKIEDDPKLKDLNFKNLEKLLDKI